MTWLNRTHIGDCRELLRQMAADGVRVQTCVTSPPYFGLRDYQTGTWKGGQASCDHLQPVEKQRHDVGRAQVDGFHGSTVNSLLAQKPYRDVCGKCGAIRTDQQIGLEPTPAEYVDELVKVFRAVRDVLADDGTLWLNIGDSYSSGVGGGKQGDSGAMASRSIVSARPGNPDKNGGNSNRNGVMRADVGPKNLLGIPWRVAFALQADGWYLRSDIIWHKPNPMPESVTDRPTKAHEYLFLLSKRAEYYYDADAIREQGAGRKDLGKMQFDGRVNRGGWLNDGGEKETDGRNRRTVWTVATQPFTGAHFACFPPALIEPCILAGAPAGGIVLDPFMGSGTTAQVATNLGRQFIGCELNQKYVALHEMRTTTIGMAL